MYRKRETYIALHAERLEPGFPLSVWFGTANGARTHPSSLTMSVACISLAASMVKGTATSGKRRSGGSLNSTAESFECQPVTVALPPPVSCLSGAPAHHPVGGSRCYQSTLRSYNKWSPTEQGATLVWRDLCVYATGKQVSGSGDGGPIKRIINNVSGAVTPGTLIALMGSSGAGKSTLMSALAYRMQRKKPYKCLHEWESGFNALFYFSRDHRSGRCSSEWTTDRAVHVPLEWIRPSG